MVYINQNSEIVNFPKVSNEMWKKIHFVNQTTKVSFDLFTSDLTDSSLYYSIDISSVLDNFEVGQYDYSFQKNDGTVICSGILQFDNFGTSSVEYEIKNTTIQYTPDETLYPQINKTINITENDTYDIENYDTAVVNVKGSGGGNLQITNVYSSTYKPTKMDIDGDFYNTCEKLYADILINFNTDIKTLWQQKDMYISIAKYSKNKHKFTVLNDEQMHDDRLKMYCWVVRHGEDNPIYWSYFYTTENFNNRVSELWEYDPEMWTVRNPVPMYRNYTYYDEYNNYATSLNQLICNGEYPQDLYNEDEIERYMQGDIDNWFVSMGTKNPIAKWGEEWWEITEDEADDLIFEEKSDFMHWIGNYKSFTMRGKTEVTVGEDEWGNELKEEVPLYAFRSYCGDYPIAPVRIADCKLLMTPKLKEKYYGKDASGMSDVYMTIEDLTEEDLPLIDKIVLKLPYTTNEILGRLYTNPKQENYIYRDWRDGIYVDYLSGCDRIGGSKHVSGVSSDELGCLEVTLRFGLCTAEQIKSGNYKELPQFTCKLYAKGGHSGNKYDYFEGYVRSVVLPKIMYN